MAKRVSLSDLARHTNLAVSTVSMALRDVGAIALETRKNVQEAARTLGYYPNPLLAALASKQFSSEQATGTPVAYLRAPNDSDEWENTTQNMFAQAREHGRRLGYSLESFKVSDFRDGTHATQVLFARGVQGVIVPRLFQIDMLPNMDWSRFSIVEVLAVGEATHNDRPTFYRTVADHFGQLSRAWDETWDLGYRRIGIALFTLEDASFDDHQRWSASQSCLKRIPRHLRIPPFFLKKKTKGEFESRGLRRWVDRHKPDAIIGFNEVFLWLLGKEGLRIPQDVGFASLHLNLLQNLPNTVAGTKEMRLECLLGAVELLDQQIRHHQVGLMKKPRTVMIHSEWLDGQTLPPKNSPPTVESPVKVEIRWVDKKDGGDTQGREGAVDNVLFNKPAPATK